jgi:long-chain fatty acid transport protein
VCALAATPPAAWAGGFEIAQQGAAAAGTASAGTARAGDPAAAWFNPAALADGGGFRAGIGVALALPGFSAEATDGSWRGSTVASVSTPAYLYLSYANADWSVSLSANIPFASGVAWPDDWAARFDAVSSEPMFFRLAPAIAYRFGPVRLSAGVHLDLGSVDTRRALDFVSEEGRVHALLEGLGVGGDAGVFWQAADWLDLGFCYKSRTELHLEGGADFEVPDSFAYRAQDQAVSADLTLPDKLVFGALGRFGAFAAVLDVGITLWSTYDRLLLDFEDPAATDSLKVNDWETSFYLRGGGEWRALEWLTLRAGSFFDQSPIPARTLGASSPDSDRVGLSVGSSAVFGDFLWIDLYYDLVVFLPRESTSDTAPLARYSGTAHFLGMGLRFHVPGE